LIDETPGRGVAAGGFLVAVYRDQPFHRGMGHRVWPRAMASRKGAATDHEHRLKGALRCASPSLREAGHAVDDLGPHDHGRVDYPDYGYRLADAVASGTVERGIVLCGSGIGMSIAVNRNPACRCALVSEPLSAALAREHNDANVLAMGARLIGEDMARDCISAFLSTEFAGGRHQARVEKLGHPAIS
jgi:ribose 5-phosphate isomerase B